MRIPIDLGRLPETLELLTFLVAADEQSLARAGRRLHVSAAAVAKRLDNLEAVLGCRLLHRGPRGVQLTEDGRRAYGRAERLVADARALLGDAEDGFAGSELSGIRQLLDRESPRSAPALLAELEDLFDHILGSVSDGIAIQHASDGRLLVVNDAFCEIVGHPRVELVYRTPVEFTFWSGALSAGLRHDAAESRQPVRTVARVDRRCGCGAARLFGVTTMRLDINLQPIRLMCVADMGSAEAHACAERRGSSTDEQLGAA